LIVSLPNNESATLRNYEELSEKAARRIRVALRSALEQAGTLAAEGFDEGDPRTWGMLKDLAGESTAIEVYQDRCIVEMVKQWTLGDLPTMETAGDLPAPTYAILAVKATEAASPSEDFTADGAKDPLAATGESGDSAATSSVVVSNHLTPTS